MVEQVIRTRGAALAVDVDGDAPVPVILCHGGPGSPDDMAGLRERLAALGVACARFDERGVGRSECLDDRWDVWAYADDVEAVRQGVGADRIVIVGHSWGGVVARAFAKRYPQRVRGVLLASPSAAVGSQWPAMEKEVMNTVRSLVSAPTWVQLGLWSALAAVPGRIGNRAMVEVYARVLRAYTGQTDVPDWVHGSSARAARRTRVEIKRVESDALDDLGLPQAVPVRVEFGDRDIYGPFAKRFAEQQVGAQTIFLNDCGHIPWHDAPDQFDAWLLEGLTASGLLS